MTGTSDFWQRVLVRKVWGWVALGVALLYNLLEVGKPLGGAFSFASGVFLLAVVGLLFVVEIYLTLTGNEERANQVGGATVAVMFVAAFWWILFTPPLGVLGG